MANVKKESSSKGGGMISGIIIVLCVAVGVVIWKFVMGAPANFEGGNPETGHPINTLGQVYKGGLIVPVLLGMLLMVIVFSIERYFVITKAAGKGNLDTFMTSVQANIKGGHIEEAIAACDKQQGSVANVVKAGLIKYQEVKRENFDTEKASEVIQKEIEQATSLEMPMLEKNLTILSTLVSLGTLLGLMGTVSGMIKAFAGLATSGTPDQAELANGISEALINTATGIGTSTFAIIMYNILTSKIDKLTYAIDEAGFSIIQTYASTHK